MDSGIFYSAATGGFYFTEIGLNPPSGAVEIGQDLYNELLANQAQGKAIVPASNGYPISAEKDPSETPPFSISPRQGKLALLDAGLLGGVESYINGLAGDDAIRAQIIWTSATEWRRDDPWLTQIALSLGLDDSQIDALFMAASKL